MKHSRQQTGQVLVWLIWGLTGNLLVYILWFDNLRAFKGVKQWIIPRKSLT